MTDKKFVKETIGKINLELYQETDIAKFWGGLQSQLNDIWKICKENKYVNVSVAPPDWRLSGCYKCGKVSYIDVLAERLETDAEYEKRKKKAAQSRAARAKQKQKEEERTRKLYLKLKAQYE